MFHFSFGERPGAGLIFIIVNGSFFGVGLGGYSFFLKGGLASIVLPPLLYFTLGISDQSSSILNPCGIILGTKSFIISSSSQAIV